MHLLFQQPAAVGVLAGDARLVVLHLLLDAAEALQLPVVLLPLLPGPLGLAEDGRLPAGGVGAVVQAVGGAPGRLALPGVLDVEHHGGGVLNQGLVVGDVEHDPLIPADKVLQPLQGLQVHITGGLIQQQHRRPPEQQPGQLELDPLPAGEALHPPAAVELLRREAQLPGDLPQFPGGQVEKRRGGGAEVVHAPLLLLRRDVLGQIAHGAGVPRQLAAPLAVGLDEAGAPQPLEQGGLPVPLLPDEHRPVPLVEDKGKIIHQGAQVLPVGQRQMFHLQHTASPPLFSVRRQQKTPSAMPKAQKNTAGCAGAPYPRRQDRPCAARSPTTGPAAQRSRP